MTDLVGATDIAILPGTEWRNCAGYRLTFQVDGNFVLYNPTGQPIWASNTWTPNDPSDVLTLRSDGNLVISRRGQTLWSTNTSGNFDAALAFQTTGNVGLYTADFQPLWSTNTSGK